jgi:hypothetical protein
MLLVAEIEKGRDLVIGGQQHISAFSSIPTVGAAARNIFFTPEANAPVASISSFDEDLCFINKFDRSNS